MKTQIIETANETLVKLNTQIIESKNEINRLEKEITEERLSRAKDLPLYLGVNDMAQAMEVLKNANGAIANVKTYHNSAKNYESKQGKKIPDRIRVLVKAEVERGNLTGTEIAKKLHISLPSVQNIKKELGMVRAYSSNS